MKNQFIDEIRKIEAEVNALHNATVDVQTNNARRQQQLNNDSERIEAKYRRALPNDGGRDPKFTSGIALLNATASDSYGDSVNVVATLKEGSFEVGEYVVYTLTAVDKYGNIYTKDTDPILVTE